MLQFFAKFSTVLVYLVSDYIGQFSPPQRICYKYNEPVENLWTSLGILQLLSTQTQIVGSKIKVWISKRVLQGNKTRKIFRKWTFLNLWYAHVRARIVSAGKKLSFFRKFDLLCFLITPVLRFPLPYHWRHFDPFYAVVHCVKYINFNWGPDVGILWKGAVPIEFTQNCGGKKILATGNWMKLRYSHFFQQFSVFCIALK